MKLSILYEDTWLLVINKPSGMLVIPTPRNEKNTLTDLLNRHMDERGETVNVHPCHRIDRETSGLIIYAKGKKNQGLMMDEFKKRKIKKAYIAFVHGKVKNDYGTINKCIYSRNRRQDEPAVTKYRATERHKNFTVLEIEPLTGKTNQIRIHFKGIGHPLVGESVYAFRKDFALKFKRAALHAQFLNFTHPITGQILDFTAPLPDDMQRFLNENP